MSDASESSDPIHLVYFTVGTRSEALRLAQDLVQNRLCACANLLPGVTSVYEWQGKICEEQECVVRCKTPESQVKRLTQHLVQLHSYDCPCVVSWPLTQGHQPFIDWVAEQTHSTSRVNRLDVPGSPREP